MTKREARRIALRLAYEAVQKAIDGGGEEAVTVEDQAKIDNALDEIVQRLFERYDRRIRLHTLQVLIELGRDLRRGRPRPDPG
jgi:hypothetical protein